jgi:long-chain acyl-CoA synthetase
VDDVAELKPHIFPGVPRVWQRVYDRISGQINESNLIRRSLVGYAFSSKKASLDKGDRSPQVWDKVVFSKIKEKFGGNLKFVSSGAAPLSAKIAEFLIMYDIVFK